MKSAKLTEGLRPHDLKNYVDNLFSIDRYRSKMGEDQDVVVLDFKVKEKYPAIDLMEFIEKGYPFILDADMSAGEEKDGTYRVFVEIERTEQLPLHLKQLLKGISQLTDTQEWRFRYQTARQSVPFNEETVAQIPLNPDQYQQRILETKNREIKQFFDQGAVEVTVESNNRLIFSKPFFESLQLKLIAIGDYESVKNSVPGPLGLDENSQSQVYFLQKYLGNYDIVKIKDQFLIKNGDRAAVVKREE